MSDREFVEAFADLMRQSQLERSLPYGTRRARALSTDALKALWDSYDGAETADPEIHGEAVHLVLNERGEGDYCRV